ncbi:MAG TPA: hypothetical protein VMW51_09730, partial [Terriglobia bacterium]|nr:hypothetical protein [Terriglobia bacterium]
MRNIRVAAFLAFALLFSLAAPCVSAQNDSNVFVKQFPGLTVGAKVAAAQKTCSANTFIPCVLVIDGSLAAYPSGTMPSLCANCSLEDMRGGVSISNGRMSGPLIVGTSNDANRGIYVAMPFDNTTSSNWNQCRLVV